MPKSKKESVVKKSPVTKKPKKVVEAAVSVVPVKAAGKTSTLTVDVYDISGKKTTMTLPEEIFGVKVNKQLLSQAVRVYLVNQRQGTVKTKSRGEVQGSSRKIYKQKGTGRARHGTLRAPIFVHGGIAFGPRPRDFDLSMPKKMKKLALFSALTSKHESGTIRVVTGLETIEPKTKVMVGAIKNMVLENAKKIMVVLPNTNEHANAIRAARNIRGIELVTVSQLTTYDVMQSGVLLFAKPAIDVLIKRTGEAQ